MASKFKRTNVAKMSLDYKSSDKRFTNYKILAKFSIDFNSALIENKPFPELNEEFLQNKNKVVIDLGQGYETCLRMGKLVTDCDKYRTEKWEHFLKVLQNKNIVVKHKPNFVSNSGHLSDMFGDQKWLVFALKFNDVIYLFKEKTLEFDPKKSGNATKKDFYRQKFLYSITDRAESEFFSINRFNFKQHRIIVCSEVDAIDKSGEPIDIKCRQKWDLKHPKSQRIILRHKLLEDWSHCLVDNVKTMVVGYRDDNILKSKEVVKVDTIPGKCGQYWWPSQRFRNVEQILNFIRISVESEDQLYGFEYKDFNRSLFCYKYNSRETNATLFLPDWYRNAFAKP